MGRLKTQTNPIFLRGQISGVFRATANTCGQPTFTRTFQSSHHYPVRPPRKSFVAERFELFIAAWNGQGFSELNDPKSSTTVQRADDKLDRGYAEAMLWMKNTLERCRMGCLRGMIGIGSIALSCY